MAIEFKLRTLQEYKPSKGPKTPATPGIYLVTLPAELTSLPEKELKSLLESNFSEVEFKSKTEVQLHSYNAWHKVSKKLRWLAQRAKRG